MSEFLEKWLDLISSVFVIFWTILLVGCTLFEISVAAEKNKFSGEVLRFAILFPLYTIFWVPYFLVWALIKFFIWLYKGIMEIPNGF